MATFRDALILSPSVDIRPYLPPVKYLQQGINFRYQNVANINPTKPNFLEMYLSHSGDYVWWDHAPNVYLPLFSRRPVFSTLQSPKDPNTGSVSTRTSLLFQISTVKVWIEEYNRASEFYSKELTRIARLEAKFKKPYTIVTTNPFEVDAEFEVKLLSSIYDEYVLAYETDLFRLEAIQYELEQRLIFFDANNALPTSNLTPEFSEYYPTTMNYSLWTYQGESSPGLPNTLYRLASTSDDSNDRRPTWHHLSLPEIVTGNPYWGTDDLDIRTYNKTNNLILNMSLRMGLERLPVLDQSPLNSKRYHYHLGNYYQDVIGKTIGRTLAPTVDTDTATFFDWVELGLGIKLNQNKEVASTIVPYKTTLGKSQAVQFNKLIGNNPLILKSSDASANYTEDSFTLPFVSAPSEIDFPAAHPTEYPVDNNSWFRGEETLFQVNDGNRDVQLSRWPRQSKPWYEFQGYYYGTTIQADSVLINEYMPGSQNVALLPESIHKVINEDTDEVFFKRSAKVEYPETEITGYYVPAGYTFTTSYVLNVKPETPHTPIKVWYGSNTVKPIYPRVWYEFTDDPLYPYSADRYIDFRSKDNGPAWLIPNSTLEVGVTLEKTFVSNTLIEEYSTIWRYDDVAGIPQEQKVILYTITYDLTPA